jgi:hypothetical protein
MLFDGWAVTADKGFGFSGRPFKGHPFNSANNTQGIGFTDANGDNTQRLPSGGGSATILAYQVAYVKKLIDELNSRNNVLWEICNEANSTSEGWQRAIIDTIKSYELRKPKQHPINYSVEYPGGNNAELFALSSHNQSASPTTDYSAGVNNDTSRIIITDSDHICGECEDGTWVYKSFCNGVGAILYMDPWNGKDYPHMVSNYDSAASNWVSARKAMGQVVAIAKMANLIDMRPSPALASTGHCLSGSSKWIAYQPGTGAFTLNLSGASGSLRTKWLNTATGTMTDGTTVQGGSTQGFTPPFSGSAILFVYSDAAVPVQLTSFTGKWTREGMVCLKWRTASETNTFGFDVQRSLDRQTYTDIPGTFVKGQGTTVAPHDYAVIDSTPFRGSSYRLKQTDLDGAVKFSETIRLNVAEDSVDSRTPLTLEILQNYPNPFNPSTTITYALPRAAHIRLVIVDAAGRRVATLIDESQTAGRHSVVWKGMNNRGIHVASGVYICVLSAGQDVRTSKLLIVR